MSLVVKNEGRPMKRALRERITEPWACGCFTPRPVSVPKLNPPYLTSCTTCGTERPKE